METDKRRLWAGSVCNLDISLRHLLADRGVGKRGESASLIYELTGQCSVWMSYHCQSWSTDSIVRYLLGRSHDQSYVLITYSIAFFFLNLWSLTPELEAPVVAVGASALRASILKKLTWVGISLSWLLKVRHSRPRARTRWYATRDSVTKIRGDVEEQPRIAHVARTHCRMGPYCCS